MNREKSTATFEYIDVKLRCGDTPAKDLGPRRDCAARGIAYFTGKKFHTVRKMLNEYNGTDSLNGTRMYAIIKVMEDLGYRRIDALCKHPDTLDTFFNVNKIRRTGLRAVLTSVTHLTVIENGKIMDTYNCGRRWVDNVWVHNDDFAKAKAMIKEWRAAWKT